MKVPANATMKPMIILSIMVLLAASSVIAQDEATPTYGALISGVAATAQPSIGAASDMVGDAHAGADSRLATCNAHLLPGFVAYTIREGDRLGDLMVGADNVTVTQLAAMNCIDDPTALPVGATIWIPGASTTQLPLETTPLEATGEAAAEATPNAVAILDFSATPDPAPNLEGVTLSWQASGDTAYFYACPSDAETGCSRPASAQPVPLESTVTLSRFPYAGEAHFRLEVIGGGETVTEDVAIEIVCSQESLGLSSGNPSCPELPPLTVFGVWQPFERGVMIYFGDTQQIYVMTNDGRVQIYQDTFVEGMAEAEFDDVPQDRFSANRGFGIVWRDLGGPDSPLGWGLAQEIGFDSARQPAGRVSYTTYIQGPGDTVYAVTLPPDTSAGYWALVHE
jgi:hypothetical protein